MKHEKPDRKFMKSDLWLKMRDEATDQQQGLPQPPLQQPAPAGAPRVDLVPPDALTVGDQVSVLDAIRQRKSHRAYTSMPLTLEELSFLLWATQGKRQLVHQTRLYRTVPSAGARHPFETYLLINRVKGVDPGLYRYLSLDHQLCFLYTAPDLVESVIAASLGQEFVGSSAVTFVWTAIPYRTEWRYSLMSPKLIALDAGHVCQSLYLACAAIGAGMCAIAAYNQELMDAVLRVDGEEEFAIYVAPLGKVDSRR
ncbi:MAG: SagB/ThcOx family dehydrogenase [Anaerolineae bacterium]|nr:SagB/ThcOx family dehydrogenase [Anaerolineae bacterium]